LIVHDGRVVFSRFLVPFLCQPWDCFFTQSFAKRSFRKKNLGFVRILRFSFWKSAPYPPTGFSYLPGDIGTAEDSTARVLHLVHLGRYFSMEGGSFGLFGQLPKQRFI
jgi:hypothetical protein